MSLTVCVCVCAHTHLYMHIFVSLWVCVNVSHCVCVCRWRSSAHQSDHQSRPPSFPLPQTCQQHSLLPRRQVKQTITSLLNYLLTVHLLANQLSAQPEQPQPDRLGQYKPIITKSNFITTTLFKTLGENIRPSLYFSVSVISNPSPSLRRPLEPSYFCVGMSETQRNSPPGLADWAISQSGNPS